MDSVTAPTVEYDPSTVFIRSMALNRRVQRLGEQLRSGLATGVEEQARGGLPSGLDKAVIMIAAT